MMNLTIFRGRDNAMTYEEVHKKLQELYDQGDIDEGMDLVAQYNQPALDLFEESLSKFIKKTIRNHMDNVRFFLNDYSTYYAFKTYEDAWEDIDGYLGDFFIRKCLWSTPATIKSTAASIKKFYKCLYEHQLFAKEDYDQLCYTIKVLMKDWQSECESYNHY